MRLGVIQLHSVLSPEPDIQWVAGQLCKNELILPLEYKTTKSALYSV